MICSVPFLGASFRPYVGTTLFFFLLFVPVLVPLAAPLPPLLRLLCSILPQLQFVLPHLLLTRTVSPSPMLSPSLLLSTARMRKPPFLPSAAALREVNSVSYDPSCWIRV